MRENYWRFGGALRPAVLVTLLCAGLSVMGAQPPVAGSQGAVGPVSSGSSLTETREQLLSLLRMSPTLAEVVASDPSLLANQEYVTRGNPELASFLQAHPEVVRNPDFYLFADLPAGPGRRVEALRRRLWSDRSSREEPMREFMGMLLIFIGFMVFLCAVLWLVKVLIDNRRWGRIFKLQTEVHGRLIDRFGSNEELLTYMGTDAGKRFLEAAPIPINFEQDQRVPAALGRVLVPLQIGIVLTLLGAGLLFLRHSLPDIAAPLLVFGTVALMPGLGFIISAGITWLLAGHLGLMPRTAEESGTSRGQQ